MPHDRLNGLDIIFVINNIFKINFIAQTRMVD